MACIKMMAIFKGWKARQWYKRKREATKKIEVALSKAWHIFAKLKKYASLKTVKIYALKRKHAQKTLRKMEKNVNTQHKIIVDKWLRKVTELVEKDKVEIL